MAPIHQHSKRQGSDGTFESQQLQRGILPRETIPQVTQVSYLSLIYHVDRRFFNIDTNSLVSLLFGMLHATITPQKHNTATQPHRGPQLSNWEVL